MQKNATVHGLRGLAAFIVFLFHVYGGASTGGFFPSGQPGLVTFLNLGQFGVELFFMISGYLITASMIRHNHIGRFLLDRYIRIYPPFIVIHLLIFAIGPLIGYKFLAHIGWTQWLYHFTTNLLLLPGVFDLPIAQIVAWSLSFEFAFYLICSVVFLLYKRNRAFALIVAALLTALLIHINVRTLFFLPGILIYAYDQKLLPNRNLGLLQVPALLLFLWFWAAPHSFHTLTVAGAVLTSLIFFLTIVREQGLIAYILNLKCWQWMGTISYSFYLWHTMVMFPLKPLIHRYSPILGNGIATMIFALVGFSLTVAISWTSYVLLEVRATRIIKKRLNKLSCHLPHAPTPQNSAT